MRRVADAINQPGRHAVVFGERGVGKTSLVSVLSRALHNPNRALIIPRINCDSGDDYSSLWRKAFAAIQVLGESRPMGFGAEPQHSAIAFVNHVPERITFDDVRRLLALLTTASIPVVIMDEFDRMNAETRRMISDTIKMLSDHTIRATLVLVGVADSVDQLIQEHESVERAVVQIQMPRMSRPELHEILEKGMQRLGMRMDNTARSYIALLSQGLPTYTHLLALHATRVAIDEGTNNVTLPHVESAIARALRDAEQSIRSTYDKAVASPRGSETLFPHVLLSCALSECGELGYFSAGDIRAPLETVTGRAYEIPSFARHLKEFCEPIRGPVLQRTGAKHRVRYRFIKPLMQPYVIMKALSDKRIGRAMLEKLNPWMTGSAG